MMKMVMMLGLAVGMGQMMGTTAQSKEAGMHHATGAFEVKMKPETLSETAANEKIGRMSIDKVFHGALEGTSKGEFLSAGGEVKGSAGYVAMERVTGTLDGKAGSFYLMHTGTMDRGVPGLAISVVPDSGTGELSGLSGTMAIHIEGGKHSYDFSYAIAGK
jgi:hypothetical protein